MGLDALVPQLIGEHAGSLVEEALEKFEVERSAVTHWALHPGGRKILENIQKELSLTGKDLAVSFDVLKEYGNMSSPTILFVLKQIMQQLDRTPQKIFAAAFGPGLTMETLILER